MTIYGVDWGRGKKVVVCTSLRGGPEDAVDIRPHPEGLLPFLMTLKKGDHVHLESTFESFEKQNADAVVLFCRERGIRLTTTASRATSNFRIDTYRKKGDFVDAHALHTIATGKKNRKALSRAKLSSEKRQTFWQEHPEVHKEVIIERTFAWEGDLSERVLAALPPPEECPFPSLLKSRKAYNRSRVIAVGALALAIIDAGKGRDVFEHAIGCFESGYPSMYRSNIFHHFMWAEILRQSGITRPKKDDKNVDRTKIYNDRVRNEALKSIRKAYRWMFSSMKRIRTGSFDSAYKAGPTNTVRLRTSHV